MPLALSDVIARLYRLNLNPNHKGGWKNNSQPATNVALHFEKSREKSNFTVHFHQDLLQLQRCLIGYQVQQLFAS